MERKELEAVAPDIAVSREALPKLLPIALTPFKVSLFLFLVSAGLLLGNLLSMYLTISGKNNLSLLGWYTAWYFDFNVETNFPSFFSTMLLMLAAVLLLICYLHSRRIGSSQRRYWLVLSIVFVFLSLDENVQIHEVIAQHLTPVLPTDLNGFIHWSWVVPYSVLVLLLGGYFLSFVLRLPSFTRRLFIISGVIFITGALGLELFEGYFFKLYGLDHPINKVLYCLEELMEMWGVILFIYALLHHLATHGVRLAFYPEGSVHRKGSPDYSETPQSSTPLHKL
jgi:hypothetical protein